MDGTIWFSFLIFFKQISSNPLASIQETDELENFGPSAES
jgi:hypothetical protein